MVEQPKTELLFLEHRRARVIRVVRPSPGLRHPYTLNMLILLKQECSY